MSILIFALVAISLYMRISKFNAHNFTITLCVSLFTFFILGTIVLLTDFFMAKSTLNTIVGKISNVSVNASDNFYLFVIGFEIVALFLLMTFFRFVLDFSHMISVLICGLILAAFNGLGYFVITEKLQWVMSNQAGVTVFWYGFLFFVALLTALLGPVLTAANLAVLVAIYGYQVNAISSMAKYFQLESLVGVIGVDKIILLLALTAAVSSIDTIKSMLDRTRI